MQPTACIKKPFNSPGSSLPLVIALSVDMETAYLFYFKNWQ